VYLRQAGRGSDERLVLRVDTDAEIDALREIFGSVRDYGEELARKSAIAARIRDAAPMPEAPQEALAVQAVDGRGLVGQLWLCESTTEDSVVCFGRDGRVVGTSKISTMFPCEGAVTGPRLDVADWSGFELASTQWSMLKNDACSLWESLVVEAAKAQSIEERRARLLRNLLLRLHAIPTAGRSWPNHDQRKLYRELRKLPLFALASGHAISLEVALRERPAELERLGLWARGEVVPVQPTPAQTPAAAAAPVVDPPPAPPAPARAVPPEERLLAAVRDELRLIRVHAPDVLAEFHLERISIRRCDGSMIARWDDAVVLDAATDVVQRALRAPDVLLVGILASAAFTVLNWALAEITDAHEIDFLRWHAAHARTARSPAATS
jgi:hypothetical protein